jgi:hypothetical protein
MGETGDAGLVNYLVIAAGAHAELFHIHHVSQSRFFFLPIPYALIDVLYIVRLAADTLLVDIIRMVKHDGAGIAPVPLLIKFHITSLNDDGASLGECLSQFFQASIVNPGECGTGYVHHFSSLFLFQSRIIGQSQRLIFFEQQLNYSGIIVGDPNGLVAL